MDDEAEDVLEGGRVLLRDGDADDVLEGDEERELLGEPLDVLDVVVEPVDVLDFADDALFERSIACLKMICSSHIYKLLSE